MKKLLSSLIIMMLSFGVLAFAEPTPVYAAANLYLAPASRSFNRGSEFSIAIREDSGADAVNAVQANLTYDPAKLEFVRIDPAGTAFPVEYPSSGGGGSVSIAWTTAGTTLTGDKLVATVVFKGIADGATNITFASGSGLWNAGVEVSSTKTGGTYTISAPTTPPSTTPTTPTTQPSAPTTTPPTPTVDKTAPKITNIKVTTSLASTMVEWTTDEPATSFVEYGLSTKYMLVAESASLTKDHKVKFDPKTVFPGITYHFRVKSADEAGNVATGQDVTFKTAGYTVEVKVVDQKGDPVGGVEVTLASEIQKAKTSKSGITTFKDVAPGKHLVMVRSKSGLVSSEIDVKEATEKEIASGKIAPRSAEVKITPPGTDPLWYAAALLAGLIAILLGVAVVWGWREWKEKVSGKKESPPTDPKSKRLWFIPVPWRSDASAKAEEVAPPVEPPPPIKPLASEKSVAKPQLPKNLQEPPTIQPRGESKMEVFRAKGSE